ncbi:pantothenate kinase [Candidatus Photodesmus blepharus]|uniref:Pantothenate kinase n=2 Tax=Candidatus Photodesmus blepharonis TaxID=1179155 RepID=A0A084CNI9_9GAMM|nr:pantothenate kinase [Candidatus Photodesmus blepharus]
MSFNRTMWAKLRNAVPMTLSESHVKELQGVNENLTVKETVEIYLPLSRLLNLYVVARQSRDSILQNFLGNNKSVAPFIVGIAGSVAVGKSTTARILRALLSRWENHPKVELVTTDGFLYPQKILNERCLMKRKGFPESYDMRRLIQFIYDIKACKPNIEVPVYSHVAYDITSEIKVVNRPDILIIEGLNVLQTSTELTHRVSIADFLDFSLYVDADTKIIEKWYVERFLKFRYGAFTEPGSYFSHYTQLSEKLAVKKAKSIWKSINGVNLEKNILPSKDKAQLILKKGNNHTVEEVLLRR